MTISELWLVSSLGVAIAAISAYLKVNGKDSDGWDFFAFCLIVIAVGNAVL
jgi:hypothetical protein